MSTYSFLQKTPTQRQLLVAEVLKGEISLYMSSLGLCPYFAQEAVCRQGQLGQDRLKSLEIPS